MKILNNILIIIAFVFLPSACALNSYSQENVAPLGPALTKLSFAMEACLKSDNPPPEDIEDDVLLMQCTEYDPTLLMPFEDYMVMVLRQNKRAVLLVCDKEKRRALIEDASCTARLDKRFWQEESPKPCEFSIEIDKVCGK